MCSGDRSGLRACAPNIPSGWRRGHPRRVMARVIWWYEHRSLACTWLIYLLSSWVHLSMNPTIQETKNTKDSHGSCIQIYDSTAMTQGEMRRRASTCQGRIKYEITNQKLENSRSCMWCGKPRQVHQYTLLEVSMSATSSVGRNISGEWVYLKHVKWRWSV